MDFSQTTYKTLLATLNSRNYSFKTFENHLQSTIINQQSFILLRHDVDRLPENSLKLAQLEHSLGIKGSYYFRIVPESFALEIMHQIAALGHEIGYHYEDVDLVVQRQKIKSLPASGVGESKKEKGKDGKVEKWKNENEKIPRFQDSNIPSVELIDAAYESFCKNLEQFRKHFDIKTICMHGSPRSKYDNKLIWQKYDYKELGIIGEPYYDIDFNEFAYFTDTGRRWNGHKVSVRDKVNSKYNFDFKTTQQIIENIDKLPDKVMFTIHPERWHSNPALWAKELIVQNLKNIVKRGLIVLRE